MVSRRPFANRLRAAIAQHWRRSLALLAICIAVALLLSVDVLFAQMQRLLVAADPIIRGHPLLGGALFVLLSGLSAMLAFFSSALLVPVAVYSWGRAWTVVLLWLGWLLGGICAYALGRFLGRPLVRSVATTRLRAFYLERLPAQVDFPVALLIQLALPSEIPGYLFGTLRVPFRVYLPALALVEAPYAAGTVLLGESVIRREGGWLLFLAAIGLGASLLAVHVLHRRLSALRREPDAPARGDDRS